MFEENGWVYGEEKGVIKTGKAIKCLECGNYLTSLEWLPPLEITLSKGQIGDVIFGTFNHFIISDKFKDIYENNGFSGVISFEPVKIYQKNNLVNKSYFYPRINLCEIDTDIEKSEIVFSGKKQCSKCQKAGRGIKKMKGLYLIGDKKIKDNIFCIKMLPGDIIVTNKFRMATKELSNLSYTLAENYKPNWLI